MFKCKRLFYLFFERITALQRLDANYYGLDKAFLKETSTIHIYVMTSPQNKETTRKIFRQFLNFCLWKKNIYFFIQG
jgi:UDP-N-acetylglucosamine pyrophosphorylase